MTELQPGDNVTANFDGIDYPGVIERHAHGWAHVRIQPDPDTDHTDIQPPIQPVIRATVCVRDTNVRKIDQ